MRPTINHIIAYITFIRERYSLAVTVHDYQRSMFSGSVGNLAKYNIHNNPYCLYVKTNRKLWDKCIQSQKKIIDKCTECGAYYGMCHAGVCELIYPIDNGKQIIGFVSVSGYRADKDDELYPRAMHKLDRLCEEFRLDRQEIMTAYETYLIPTRPDRQLCDTLIHPLCDMLKLGLIESVAYAPDSNRKEASNFLYYDIINYINSHHNTRIDLKTLSETFNYSESYISHMFKSSSGMTLNQYINTLRIDEAKAMLNATDMSIQEISSIIGFNDSNYFTNVFHKLVGMSPREYRNINLYGYRMSERRS